MIKVEAVIRNQGLRINIDAKGLKNPSIDLSYRFTSGSDIQTLSLPLKADVNITPQTEDGQIFSAYAELPQANHTASNRINGIDFKIYDDGAIINSDRIDAKGWQVSCLHIPDRSTFNQIMRYVYQRIDDPETLMYVTLNTARDDNVELRIRITNFVVFCYRAIELDRADVLLDAIDLFSEFESKFNELERFKTGSVREVGEQVALSLLSVKWHTQIYLGHHSDCVTTLRQILDRGRNNPQYHQLPFATNYANAAVLLTFLHFRKRHSLQIPTPVSDLYSQFRNIMANLPENLPPYEYLLEFKPVLDQMTILTDMEWLLKAETVAVLASDSPDIKFVRRQKFAEKKYTEKMIMNSCTRVKGANHFDEAFSDFCKSNVI